MSGLNQNPAKPVVIGTSVVSIGNQAAPTGTLGLTGASTSLDNVSLQLPKVLSEQMSKLPPEQKLLYVQQLLKSQHLKQQQQQQQKTVREKQMKLVQEQQVPLVMGVARPASAVGVARSTSTMAKPASVGVVRTVASAGVGANKTSSVMDGRGKVSLVSVKVAPMTTTASLSSAGAVGGGKKKGKGKETSLDVE